MTTQPPATSPGTYSFLPWIQGGIARSIPTADEPAAALSARVTMPVAMTVQGAGDVSTSIQLYGPGDVTGLDPAQIVRRDPAPGSDRFEAGYLPQVQFARADLPWLFTPAAPGTARTRLRPWLVLIAVRRGDGVKLGGNVLELSTPAAELPDLSQSWAWAHTQITGLPAGTRAADLLTSDPGRACSRLVCPRRLEPDTGYLACLVPAFAIGVKAGLGQPITAQDEARLDPAWPAVPTGPLRLPVYDAWEFATGPAGSFETLVRRLHPSPLDPATARPPRLDLSAPGGGLPAAGVVEMQSALRAPGPDVEPAGPGPAFQAALAKTLTGGSPEVLAPPVYGQLQAGVDGLPAAGWLRELNLDPRLRIAAAAGTRVVQERQEQLMARAWEQAGAVQEVNALLRGAQVARELGTLLMERHLGRLPAASLIAFTQPAHARISLAGGTVDGELRASRVPEAAVSGAMLRLTSQQGVIARRALVSRPVDMLAAADKVAMKSPITPPTGMVIIAGFSSHVMAPVAAAAPRPPVMAVVGRTLQAQLLEHLDPATTVLERSRSRIDAPASTWTRPDPLAQTSTGPHFTEPMYDGLQQVAPELFLPGAQDLDADGVALLEITPRVIEAYLAGLNHELSRELLWREFPAPLTGTAFRQFWDVSGQPGDPESLADIPPMSEWDAAPLGGHLRGAGHQLVLLLRGELLRRYPTTTIYAARASANGTLDPATRLAPMFRATLPPDLAVVGFALGEEEALAAPGWYFVFEQYPGEPRFGFDDVAVPGVPKTADALAWAHVPVTANAHADLSRPLAAAANLQAMWNRDAATTAALTFQQPFRVALHASRLIARSTA